MRIPTYSFRKTPTGIQVYGPGTSTGDICPNLIFVRNKDYRFRFFNRDSVIELYDKSGNVLFSGDDNSYEIPVTFRFGASYPNQIRYKIKNGSDAQYGNINIRDFDKVSGKVISYGYTKNAEVFDNETQTLTTDSNGKFNLDLNLRIVDNLDTYFASFDLYTRGGFDSAVLNINSETYSDELPLEFRAKSGSLHINCFSTLFWFIDQRVLTINYRDIEKKMQNYFGLTESYDPITDDPIYSYLTGGISLNDFCKYILLTCIAEYESIVNKNEEDKFNFYDRLAVEIIDGTGIFDYSSLNNLITKKNEDVYSKFLSAFLALSSRVLQMSDETVKKVCVLESIYNLLYKFRNSIFKNIISYEMFLADDFSLNKDTISVPDHPRSMLLSYVDGCSIAPFGKYAKIEISPQLIRSILNQTLPVESEITNNLLNKTLYIKHNESDYFCYKIIDYIDYEYELKNLLSEQVMHGFDSSLDCCTLETISAQSLQDKNIELDVEVDDESLLELKIFNIEKNEILTSNITNKSKPFLTIEDKINTERFYLDEYPLKKIGGNVPALVAIPKVYSKRLTDVNGLAIACDGRIKNYIADHIRYDYIKLQIENATLSPDNDVVTFDTTYSHGYTRGDKLVIQNSSKDGLLNGMFEVSGVTDKTITINFNLPSGKNETDINGTYGEIESLNFTKVYVDVEDFAVHDEIFFEQFNKGVSYRVSALKKDYIGEYLVVSGVVPRNCKNFTRKSRVPITKALKFSRSFIPEIYNLEENGNPIDLEKYDIFSPADPGSVTAAVAISWISYIELRFKQETSEIIQDGGVDIDDIDFSRRKLYLPKMSEQDVSSKNIIDDSVAYHFSRGYLRKDYELEGYEDVGTQNDTWDWNGDGVVGKDELKILERVIMTRPSSLKEYNIHRENYPRATTLPTLATAQYACQENCCHDDFTETDEFTIDDVYIYDAFQAYIDTVGQESVTEPQEFLDHYDSLEVQGISPWLFDEMVYMPTNPKEQKFCGDYTNTGTITADDAHIYYAHHLYVQERGEAPDSVYRFSRYYDTLVRAGIVPELVNFPEKLPSLASETSITGADENISKNCEQLGGKDLLIYMEWLRQGKPIDIDEFNAAARAWTTAIPRACFLPIDEDDFAPDEYEDFGFSSFTFDEVYEGLENL